jgi:hypothetical protein
MSKPKKPRKLTKAERIKQELHQRVQYDRAQVQTAARDAHLRELIGLPTQQDRAK